MKRIPGFDYIANKPVERTRAEWREFHAQVGGWIHQRDGETFIHTPVRETRDGRVFSLLAAEIYAQGVVK